VAREGQQTGKLAKLFSNVTPAFASFAFIVGIARIDSTVWSSVISSTMFGRFCFFAGFLAASPPPGKNVTARQAARPNAATPASRLRVPGSRSAPSISLHNNG
jgi:hypothetical protein